MKSRAKNWILRPYLVAAHWIEKESTIIDYGYILCVDQFYCYFLNCSVRHQHTYRSIYNTSQVLFYYLCFHRCVLSLHLLLKCTMHVAVMLPYRSCWAAPVKLTKPTSTGSCGRGLAPVCWPAQVRWLNSILLMLGRYKYKILLLLERWLKYILLLRVKWCYIISLMSVRWWNHILLLLRRQTHFANASKALEKHSATVSKVIGPYSATM